MSCMPGLILAGHIAYDHRSDRNTVECSAVGGNDAIGGLVLDRPAAFQAELVGQFCRYRDITGTSIEHELHGLAIDFTTADIVTEAITFEQHFLGAGVIEPAENGLIRVALLVEPVAEKQGKQYQQDNPRGDSHALANAAGIRLLRRCHMPIVNQYSLVNESQSGKYMALVGFKKIAEAGTFDCRAGVQAATFQGVMKVVEPGLRVFIIREG